MSTASGLRVCGILFIAFSFFSCQKKEDMKQSLDYLSFRMTGSTVFNKPNLVTTKELHFDTGRMVGREVILNGTITELGKYDTYLVLSDGVGRMLVVLTHIEGAGDILNQSDDRELKVLGSVERGKKGLPYVLAKSIKLTK